MVKFSNNGTRPKCKLPVKSRFNPSSSSSSRSPSPQKNQTGFKSQTQIVLSPNEETKWMIKEDESIKESEVRLVATSKKVYIIEDVIVLDENN
jgi:hypothetical protein